MARIIGQKIWPDTTDGNTSIKNSITLGGDGIIRFYYIGVQSYPYSKIKFNNDSELTINSTGFFEFNVPDNMEITKVEVIPYSKGNLPKIINRQVIVDYVAEVKE